MRAAMGTVTGAFAVLRCERIHDRTGWLAAHKGAGANANEGDNRLMKISNIQCPTPAVEGGKTGRQLNRIQPVMSGKVCHL